MRRRALVLLAEGLDAVLHQRTASCFPAARGGVAGTSSSRSTAAWMTVRSAKSTSSLLSNFRALSSLTRHEASTRSPEWDRRVRSGDRMASTTTAANAEEAAEEPSTPPTPATTSAAAASPTSSLSSPSPSSSSSSSSSSPPYFEVIGRLQGKADFPQDPSSTAAAFAVVDFGGTQHKACPGDLLFADGWLDGRVDINDVVRFTRVLAVGSAGKTRIGRPALPGVSVTAAVEELVLDAKQLHFTKRRRKASRRLKGHRQPLTALRVLELEGAGV